MKIKKIIKIQLFEIKMKNLYKTKYINKDRVDR